MADCCSAPGLMPFAQAKAQVLNNVIPVSETENIDLLNADKRVVAKDVTSPINVPAHNNSAMDGYGLCYDLSENAEILAESEFTLVGISMAGRPFSGNLLPGQCIRIMTGAVVPAEVVAVEMQENVTRLTDAQDDNLAGTIKVNQTVPVHNHIRLAGEDITQGESVFKQGHLLSSIDIGLLSSLGVPQVNVYRKVKVAVFSTGDELKSPGEALGNGDIYESNRHVVIAILNRMNLDVIDLGIIEDDPELIKAAFNKANDLADAVISSGGVSVGDADYTKEVLDELGQIGFWKVAMKPGKPFAFGQLSNSVFFGLPGNPVSSTVTFHQLTIPALQKMSGTQVSSPLTLKAKTTARIKKSAGRMDFQRGIVRQDEEGELMVTPLSHQGSGVLSSMSNANCYIVLSQEHTGSQVGETVDIQLFDTLIS